LRAEGHDDALQWRLRVAAGEAPPQPRRASMGGDGVVKTRPLAPKLETLLDYIFRRLIYTPEHPVPFSAAEFVKRMKKKNHELGS